MEMDLAGIKNQNEYYTNHYFTSIFKENAEETISAWKNKAKEEECSLPWNDFRDTSRQYYRIRERYLYSKNEENSKTQIQEMAALYLRALGYGEVNSVIAQAGNEVSVPVFHEVTKSNGAPLLWAFVCVAQERGEDILQSKIYAASNDEDTVGETVELCNDDIMSKLFFAGEEAPRFIVLIGINQIALIDRNKWNEKRFLQFDLEEIFSRHSESTFMALTVLLHKESLCPSDGACVLDNLDENSHKHSAGVSDALKYALRECIEILGNEVIYDMKTRQGIDIDSNPIDASELTLECLRYMYRFLFMLFIEARPELGYAPMKSQTYVQGYSLEGLRDICDRLNEMSETISEGYYLDDTISELFRMIYEGYPGDLDEYKKAIEIEKESMHDAFTIEALKAHIFDPEYTKLITKAKIRNCAMLQIIDLMSISRPGSSKQRRGRISYSALGINQMGAVYEALLSYRGFIAEETLFEVKRAGDTFNELDVGYFIPERELENYAEDERVRVNDKDPKSPLRKYDQGSFIYRLAGREREKSASYYTPEVLTKCLVKYALKELLKDKTADEILELTICEPAMGSAAFLNEAINQIAEAYLNKKQEELGETIAFDKRFEELQKVKMFIADRNVYGVDLNPIAVELAEVSLWLNTIYKGAYVPWFGTQLVCGNSLIGARRQVYPTSKLTKGKWYEEAPIRVTPGEARLRKGQKKVTKGIYHFLLGDPGMANYTDKVIKGLEPDNIKKINDWRKEFTKKYDDDDVETLLNLSEMIDELWGRTVDLRKKLENATSDPLSVYGHEEVGEGTHLTIREKDDIYHKMFKSEHMNNAGPYARLKAAMDYWCALWFWPIDKADLLPSRQEFFFEMSLILVGGLQAVNVNSSGQMSFGMDDSGEIQFFVEGEQLALDFTAQYNDLGVVCLDDLRERSERLAIANQIAEEQKFQHWELEFADVFDERGGFDLMVGNPPWIKLTWEEFGILSDKAPGFAIKDYTASETKEHREEVLDNIVARKEYVREYISISSQQSFLNAYQNYPSLKGQQTNLYKCFLPQSEILANENGIFAFVHPNSIYDDPKGKELRRCILPKLRYHFHFWNEFLLFDILHTASFSLNVYGNLKNDEFICVSNLYLPETIDDSFQSDGSGIAKGLKGDNGWITEGHRDRLIKVGTEELLTFAKVFDGNTDNKCARLPVLHVVQYYDVLKCISDAKSTIEDLNDNVYCCEMIHETNAQKNGLIIHDEHIPVNASETILSGPHIGFANPFYKSSRKVCKKLSDYDSIDLNLIKEDFIQRCHYSINVSHEEYISTLPRTPWGEIYIEQYRLVARKMLYSRGEHTLISAIIPPGVSHINGIFGMAFKNIDDLLLSSGMFYSIISDFVIKVTGAANLGSNNALKLPMFKSKYSDMIIHRVLKLSCLSHLYSDLWEKGYKESFSSDIWGKDDLRLSNIFMSSDKKEWDMNYVAKNEYVRRQLLLEIDVLVSMMLGISLDQLKAVYRIQFAVLKQNEYNTWYDKNGRIIYTSNKSLTNVGVSTAEWLDIKDKELLTYTKTLYDESLSDECETYKIDYIGPFDKCDREKDYDEIWENFTNKFR